MSVLQIVGTVAGAAIGFVAGGPAGALLGAGIGGTVGSVANSIVNPQRIEGARIGDLTVQSSAFGAVRPIGYGKIRVAGNVIWALPLQEHKSTTTSKGGGKGGPVTTNYAYGATFALALCEGPADAVLRIWADSKLVYDASSGSDAIRRPGFNFRFYPGNGTQTADSIIEANEGVGNVPGYRGTCYIVFDDIPLADYGNRIPNITAEVVFSATAVFDYQTLVRASPSLFASLRPEAAAVNPVTHVGYVFGFSPAGIVEFNLDTMVTTREKTMADILAPLASGDTGGFDPAGAANLLIGLDSALYFVTQDFTHGPHIVRVDPVTLLATAEFAAPSAGTDYTSSTFCWADKTCFVSFLDATLGRIDRLVVGSVFNAIGMLSVPDLTYVWGVGVSPAGVNQRALCQGKIDVTGEAWLITSDSNVYISRIVSSPAGGEISLAATFVATDFDAAATGFYFAGGYPGGLIYDEGDDTLLFQVDLTTGSGNVSVLTKWSPDSGLIFITPGAFVGDGQSPPLMSRISSGTYARLYGVSGINATVYTINSASGAVISSDAWPIGLGAAGAVQLYDSQEQIILAFISGSTPTVAAQWAKLRLGRFTSTGTTLGTIFLDQCERAGFTSGDIDVTALTDPVDGYVISQRAMVADVISPLMGAYLVDAPEIDGILTFRHRGGSTVVGLVQDDLVRVSDTQEPFAEIRAQEIELPMRVTYTYIDSDRDYQTNTQAAKRARHPNPTVFTDNQTDVNIAVVTQATPAKRAAERILASVWNERSTFQARLAPKFGFVNATDPVTLTLDDGYVIRGRLGKADVGVDYSIDTTIIEEIAGQYVSAAQADPGIPWPGNQTIGPVIGNVAASKLILLDATLLRDGDDLGGVAMRGYWGGGSYVTTGNWPGAQLQASPDGVTWTTIDSSTTEMTWGAIETPPPDPVSPWRTQFGATMTVQVAGGTYVPTATDDLGLANLANPMAIIKANGEVEIIQYRDVTALGSGRYTLGTFYRGVRGTDAMAGGVAHSDTFVFLSTAGVGELAVPLADHNVNVFFRLVTNGALGSSAVSQSFTFHGRDLMPYAPVHGAATLSGSDIVLTWVRRTRFGGEMRDGVDTVPLNEETEAYQVDILSGVHGSVLRTLSATTPTVTYAFADITTDFGSTPATLSVNIYQMSAVVGRGFAIEELLDVVGLTISPVPAIAITSIGSTGTTSSTLSVGFSYTVHAPANLTAVWQPGSVPATVSGFSASAGTGSATVTTPASNGTYTLSITGTGSNLASATAGHTTVMSGGGGGAGVPVITPATFIVSSNSSGLAVNGQTAASPSITNSPTSCTITGGTAGTYLAVSSSGVLTVNATGASAIVPSKTGATYTVTMTATNSDGTSAAATITLVFYPDGALDAPAGTIQLPSLFSAYGGRRPPWQVAGVDYYVGLPTGTSLSNPTSGGLPSGASYDSGTHQVTLSSNGTTFDGWDMTVGGGVGLIVDASNCIVQNCSFAMTTHNRVPILIESGGNNCTVRFCTIDEGGRMDTETFGGVIYVVHADQTTGPTIEYNEIKNAAADFVDIGKGTTINRFNLMTNDGELAGTHPDFSQSNPFTLPSTYTPIIEFNTWINTYGTSNIGGQGAGIGDNGCPVVGAAHFDNNVLISDGAGNPAIDHVSISYWAIIDRSSFQSGASATCANNWADVTSAYGFAYPGTAGAGVTFSNNKNLVNGASFSNTP